MSGPGRVVVVCLVDSMSVEKSPEGWSGHKGCEIGSGRSLGPMEMYHAVEEGVGLVDLVAFVESMDCETDFDRFGTGFGFGSFAADWAGLAMGCRCYAKPYL